MIRVPTEWWKNTCEMINHPVACVGPMNVIWWANPAFCKLVGYSMLELQSMTWMDFTVSSDVAADLKSVNDVISGNSEFYETSKRYRHKLGHEVAINLAVWKYPKDIGEQLLCFIVEAPKTRSSHQEFSRVIDLLEKRIDEMEKSRKSSVNVNVGDNVTGDKSGRDKITNDAKTIKFLTGALVAMAVAVVWIAYYNSDAENKPPPPTTLGAEE